MISRIHRYRIFLITLLQLGVMNIMRVALYRVFLKTGYYKRKMGIKRFAHDGVFFAGLSLNKLSVDMESSKAIILSADRLMNGTLQFFSHFDYNFREIPDWFYDPFAKKQHQNNQHWADINEFGFQGSDIKILWEASRFGWAPTFAQAYVLTNEPKYLKALNIWIDNWCCQNPVNQGVQWKCGQETSLRLLHFLSAMKILGETDTPPARSIEFVERHLERISPTIFYAQAQRNNHLTSEAAALFIGGSWLMLTDSKAIGSKKRARQYYTKGRNLLEWASKSLIYEDGSFSQNSVVYHRLMLNSYSLCETWRKYLHLPDFSDKLIRKLQKATDWLFWFTDPQSGNAPNLGGNDGAHLFNFCSGEYGDFRPSVQLASFQFYSHCLFGPGQWDEQIRWISDTTDEINYLPQKRHSKLFPDGGYYIHVNEGASEFWCLFRLPYYKDRPPHSDALHFDLWVNGVNILHDSGSYSYSIGDKSTISNLKGVVGHNTVQFDNGEQMPVLGRFLFGVWLRGKWSCSMESQNNIISANYKDHLKNFHSRVIKFSDQNIIIIDELSGPAEEFFIRWNSNQWPLPYCEIEIVSKGDISTNYQTKRQYSSKYLKMKGGNSVTTTGRLNNTMKIVTKIHIDGNGL